MWRGDEFDRLTFPEVLDRMAAAFDGVGDPTIRLARPGRSRDEVESRLAEITATPHPDLVEWFCFVDGYDFHPGISPGGGGDPLSLDEAVSIWESMQPEITAGIYEHGRPTFVPFTRAAAVSCDPDRHFGAVVEFSTRAIQNYLPSLGHLCWYLTALREEGVFYYLGEGLPLERVMPGIDEWSALKQQFVIQRLLDESDDGVFPIGIG